MEKLLELLNQYEEEERGEFAEKWTYYDTGYHRGEDGYYYSELLMISNIYGFIQWLYDKGFAYWKGAGLLNDMYIDDYSDRKSTVVEATIMKLSIEDEPINFLISILK